MQLFTRIFPSCNLPFTISGAPDVRIFRCFPLFWALLKILHFESQISDVQPLFSTSVGPHSGEPLKEMDVPSMTRVPEQIRRAIRVMWGNNYAFTLQAVKGSKILKAKHLQRFSEYPHALIFKGRKTAKTPTALRPEKLATRPSSNTICFVPEQFMMILQCSWEEIQTTIRSVKVHFTSFTWFYVWFRSAHVWLRMFRGKHWTSSWCPASCLVVAEICKAEGVGKSTFTKLPCPDGQICKNSHSLSKSCDFELNCLLKMSVFRNKTGHMQVSMHWQIMANPRYLHKYVLVLACECIGRYLQLPSICLTPRKHFQVFRKTYDARNCCQSTWGKGSDL